MKRHYFLILLSSMLCIQSYSQYDPDYNSNDEEDLSQLSFKDRLYTGGNFWASFGTFTNLEISPLLGYRVTKDYSVGMGLKYNYFKRNLAPVFSTSIYGGSAFTRYSFFDRLVAHAEFELLSVELFNGAQASQRTLVPIGLVGGGVTINGFQALLLYDLIGDVNNPYIGTFGPNSRIYLRAGFLFNL